MGHTCERCYSIRHGIHECNNLIACENLKTLYLTDILPRHKWCTNAECDRPETHMFLSHTKSFDPQFYKPPSVPSVLRIQSRTSGYITCPICRSYNFVESDQVKIYCNSTCPVCYSEDSGIHMFMPKCGHTVCNECFSTLYSISLGCIFKSNLFNGQATNISFLPVETT